MPRKTRTMFGLEQKTGRELVRLWYKGSNWLKNNMEYSSLFERALAKIEAIEDELRLRVKKHEKSRR